MIPHSSPLITPRGSSIFFQDASITPESGAAVIYFALSASLSLHADPFNQPVSYWNKKGIRVFSWDLPFHGPDKEGIEQDPHDAMHLWAHEIAHHPCFVSNFIESCMENIQFLCDEGYIDITRTAVAGLSRGGFIAAHLAAQHPGIKTVLGFAPLTHPRPLAEFQNDYSTHFENSALTSLVDHLTDKHLRFYIGNHDQRVGTDSCYQFIHHLTEKCVEKGIRSPPAELIIYPSIGHKGHGTPPHIFQSGAEWLAQRLYHS